MNIRNYPLFAGQWFLQQTPKRHIVWHGTQGRTRHTPAKGMPGNATTSIHAWNRDSLQVGAPWLVDRDGTCYRTFDDSGWIYHLGLPGTHGRFDKSSVAIELANELSLRTENAKLYAFDHITPSTQYIGPWFSQPWRRHTHWADLDEPQVDAAIALTLDICERNAIDPVFFYPSTEYAYPRCFEVATILCHSNCREDKSDLILRPWVWEKIRAAGIRVVG